MIEIEKNLKIYFPLDLKPRPQQIEILNFTKRSINNGKKFILINAPTGSGKSYYVMMLSNWYKNYVNEEAKIDIITNSKILQSQYKDDFDFIADLRGQSNYKCKRHKTDCHTGKEMNKSTKQMPCGKCPYDAARKKWIESEISLTNFHLFNSFAFYVRDNFEKRSPNVLIIDEAHDFESVFCDFISVKLSGRILKNYGFEEREIELYEEKFRNIKTAGSFVNFIKNDFVPRIIDLKQEFEMNMIDVADDKLKEIYAKYAVYIEGSEERLESFLDDFEENEYNWALDVTRDKHGNIELIMQPIWGNVYLNDVIYDMYDHVIFMSGSILDKKMFSYLNGFDENLTDYYELDSVIDKKNKPIYYINGCGKMTFESKQITFKKQIKIIERILKKYENDKGVIHTVNYELSNWIKRDIKDKRLLFHDTENRDEIYNKFIRSKNKVIVSPSMTTGIDLKEDLSRFQIILKMPYPNISSNKIKSRQSSNPRWYFYRTCIEVLQASGRIVRSEDDWGHTFIMDASFSNLLKWAYFPKYFIDSIKILK